MERIDSPPGKFNLGRLEKDTIALAAGTVTAALAANAAAMGAFSSPEKVASSPFDKFLYAQPIGESSQQPVPALAPLKELKYCLQTDLMFQVVQRTWHWLAEQPEDAAELAQLLYEATPRLGVPAARSPKRAQQKSGRRPAEETVPLLDRLKAAESMPTGKNATQQHSQEL